MDIAAVHAWGMVRTVRGMAISVEYMASAGARSIEADDN